MNITLTITSEVEAQEAIRVLQAYIGKQTRKEEAPAVAQTVSAAPAPAPTVPVTTAPALKVEDLQRAAGDLIKTKTEARDSIKALMTQLGIANLTQCPEDKLAPLAQGLRALGAAV